MIYKRIHFRKNTGTEKAQIKDKGYFEIKKLHGSPKCNATHHSIIFKAVWST